MEQPLAKQAWKYCGLEDGSIHGGDALKIVEKRATLRGLVNEAAFFSALQVWLTMPTYSYLFISIFRLPVCLAAFRNLFLLGLAFREQTFIPSSRNILGKVFISEKKLHTFYFRRKPGRYFVTLSMHGGKLSRYSEIICIFFAHEKMNVA